jgi:hypothetical protein
VCGRKSNCSTRKNTFFQKRWEVQYKGFWKGKLAFSSRSLFCYKTLGLQSRTGGAVLCIDGQVRLQANNFRFCFFVHKRRNGKLLFAWCANGKRMRKIAWAFVFRLRWQLLYIVKYLD